MPGDSHGTWTLAISVVALVLGPLLHAAARRERVTMAALDSFVLVAVTGLVALEIVPRALSLAGWPAFVALLAGLAGPAIAEGPLRMAARGTHRAALTLAILGMALHAFTDGLALALAHLEEGDSHGLEVAVIAHQLPVAVGVWWLLSPAGFVVAAGALLLLGAATVAGYVFADASFARLDAGWLGLFHAAVGGLLLHVVGHRSQETDSRGARIGAVCGGLFGLGLLVALASETHGEADPLARTLASLGELVRESAPALLLAYALAGLVSGLMPEAPVRWLRRGGPAGQALRGMAVGLPLPLCSCGVVPVYRSLLQRGVPAAAAMAFFIATPELGVDAILLSWPLLGAEMTVLRVVAAALVAWLVGWWVGGRARRVGGSSEPEAGPRGPVGARLWAGLRTGFGELVDTTAPWIGLGLLVAALIEPWIDPSALMAIPGPAQVLLFAAVGVPIYVCASGATPLVAALLAKGLSPGAALAFLLTGPATNATTFGVLAQEHGRATAARFAAAMLVLAVGLGLLVDVTLPQLRGVAGVQPEAGHGPLAEAAAWALAGLFLLSFVRQGPQAFFARLWEREGHSHDHGHEGHSHAPHSHAHGHHEHHSHEHHSHEHHSHEHASDEVLERSHSHHSHEEHSHGPSARGNHSHHGHSHSHHGHSHPHEEHSHHGHSHSGEEHGGS
ncbi:permease [Nannocystis punicea]|uniref:Permease n=1 Tax=Nannocystis punicea TaxID=2995304 RepID=A0ABY7H6K2_9BACT|nr:permease [Nannocystis poenicansa]WAS94904.1 permease [Nannocystis poenicansa]